MRLFIGVWLAPAMVEEVAQFIGLARKTCSGFKWTGPENLHFTLKFLGETSPEKVRDLHQALETAAAAGTGFELRLGEAGYFPPKGAPRIIWLGVETGREQLVDLVDAVEKSCVQYGFSREDKPFKPHLTIGRAKGEDPVVKLPETEKFESMTEVKGFSLIESKLLPAGPVYKSVRDFKLK